MRPAHRFAREHLQLLQAALSVTRGAGPRALLAGALAATVLASVQGLPAAFQRPSPAPWAAQIAALKGLPLPEQARNVSAWANQQLRYEPDESRGVRDEWASPWQSLARKAGDCEDYAILKYGALRAAGVSPGQVRLAYVLKQDAQQWVPHMVVLLLAPGKSWGASSAWVLDNLTDEVFPLDQRRDLRPVFSMGELGIWAQAEKGPPARPVAALHKWADLLARMRAEGSLGRESEAVSRSGPAQGRQW